MSEVRFTSYGTVAGQGSMNAFVSASTGDVIVTHPHKLTAWRQHVGYDALQAMRGRQLLEGPLELQALFYIVRGKTVKRDAPHVKPDIDKLLRGIGDALEGIVYVNDSQIIRIVGEKFYGEPSRVEVVVMQCEVPK